MADRVSASIVIGGAVLPEQFEILTELIASHDLSTEWDGPKFAPDQRVEGEPLRLYAVETPWGMFDDLEQYCTDEQIAFVRWSGACPGSFGAERIVFDGKTGPLNDAVDEDDHIVCTNRPSTNLGRCARSAPISNRPRSSQRRWRLRSSDSVVPHGG